MENIVIAPPTASWFWAHYADSTSDAPSPTSAQPFAGELPSAELIERARLLMGLTDESGPLHLYSPTQAFYPRNKKAIAHSASLPLPSGSFMRLARGIFIASPELCYLNQARKNHLPQAVLWGMQLCGCYAIDPTDPAALPWRQPITSKAKISSYVSRALPSKRRSTPAHRYLRWLCDNARSPMESALAVMLCLPLSEGGWALPLPQMNAQVDISREAQALLGIPYCSCDLYWPEFRLAIEYDSRQFHATYDAGFSDSQRKIALENEGLTIIPIHPEQIRSDAAFKAIAMRIYRIMGKRYRCDPAKHAEARSELRRQLRDAFRNPPFYS